MTLAEKLTNEILLDNYFLTLFQKIERIAAHDLFLDSVSETVSQKEYLDLMRCADILSHSTNADARNKSYKIVALLVKSFGNSESFKIFAGAILAKLGNFPALKFLRDNSQYVDILPLEREIEKWIKSGIPRSSASGSPCRESLKTARFSLNMVM